MRFGVQSTPLPYTVSTLLNRCFELAYHKGLWSIGVIQAREGTRDELQVVDTMPLERKTMRLADSMG